MAFLMNSPHSVLPARSLPYQKDPSPFPMNPSCASQPHSVKPYSWNPACYKPLISQRLLRPKLHVSSTPPKKATQGALPSLPSGALKSRLRSRVPPISVDAPALRCSVPHTNIAYLRQVPCHTLLLKSIPLNKKHSMPLPVPLTAIHCCSTPTIRAALSSQLSRLPCAIRKLLGIHLQPCAWIAAILLATVSTFASSSIKPTWQMYASLPAATWTNGRSLNSWKQEQPSIRLA